MPKADSGASGMTALRFVTALNWAVIALLGFLVVAETLTPAKGGEAAGRGIGQFFYYLAIAALVVLLVLNLLPYAWARYAALGLVLLPIFFWQIHPAWQKLKRAAGSHLEQAKPIFPDPARERIARAIQDGKADVVRELLRTPPANLNDNGELLAFAIQAANQSTYKPAERLACLELLFQAGTRLDAVDRGADVPIHFAVADAGHAALLRLLLKQGADANAVQRYFKRPILFEAVASHQEPEASVKALLDFGAQPNATATFDDDLSRRCGGRRSWNAGASAPR